MQKIMTALITACALAVLLWAGAFYWPKPGASSVQLIAHGYGGDIVLQITKDDHGAISNIRILSENETLSYTGPLDKYVRQFIGKKPGDLLVIGQGIDGISGATVTSQAIAAAINIHLNQADHGPGSKALHEKLAASGLSLHEAKYWRKQ